MRTHTLLKSLLLCMLLCSGAAFTQALPWLDDPPPANSGAQQVFSSAPLSDTMAPAVDNATAPSTVTIPAGTRVMMVLESPLHTTSGTAGSGLYLETLFPVIQENRVVIPAHTHVQGEVKANRRPGHFNRSAEFGFRFTSLVFPNNHTAAITGALQSIPGAKNIRTHDKSGSLETVDQVEKVITPVAVSTVSGALIGSVSRLGVGKFSGAGLGAALGLGGVLLKRGDEINLAQGTHVEMVLQAPLSLEQAQIEANSRYIPAQHGFTQSVEHPPANSDPIRVRRPPSQLRPVGLLDLLTIEWLATGN